MDIANLYTISWCSLWLCFHNMWVSKCYLTTDYLADVSTVYTQRSSRIRCKSDWLRFH